MTVVAISAAYGARGGLIGPALAERLGVPFVDRVITNRVAGELDVTVDEAHRMWEPPGVSFLERILSSLSRHRHGRPGRAAAEHQLARGLPSRRRGRGPGAGGRRRGA